MRVFGRNYTQDVVIVNDLIITVVVVVIVMVMYWFAYRFDLYDEDGGCNSIATFQKILYSDKIVLVIK